MERYLRIKGTDIVHIYTETLARRDDTVEVDMAFIKNQIKMKKALIADANKELEKETHTTAEIQSELKALKNLEAEHADLQAAIQREKDAQAGIKEPEPEPAEVTTDPDVILIRDMKTAKEVTSYLSGEHGIEVSHKDYKGDAGLLVLKEMAVEARIAKVNGG